uniref:Uncharacterized protein n=1 Tax=Theropithecus gelada TaxID=9565 RepID=A0A8D2K2I0_THEGE
MQKSSSTRAADMCEEDTRGRHTSSRCECGNLTSHRILSSGGSWALQLLLCSSLPHSENQQRSELPQMTGSKHPAWSWITKLYQTLNSITLFPFKEVSVLLFIKIQMLRRGQMCLLLSWIPNKTPRMEADGFV